MGPDNAARIVRRMAEAVDHASAPSRSSVSSDLQALVAAVGGNKDAHRHLARKFVSGVPALASLDEAFVHAGLEAPSLRHVGSGVFAGRSGEVTLQINVHGKDVQKVLVAGRSVGSWKEAAEAFHYFSANPRLIASEDPKPETPEEVSQHVGEEFPCYKCGHKIVVTEENKFDGIQCPSCNEDYEICLECNKIFPSSCVKYDACPMCGHSSWGIGQAMESEDWIAPYQEIFNDVEEIDFPSKSGRTYRFMWDSDTGTLSCSCPAWKIQKNPPAARTCKHLREKFGDANEAARVKYMSGWKQYEQNAESGHGKKNLQNC